MDISIFNRYIGAIMMDILNNLQALSAEIEQFNRLREEMYLSRLLNGEYGNQHEALQPPDCCKFQLDGAYYAVLSIAVDNFSSEWLTASTDSFFSVRNTIIPVVKQEFHGFLEGWYSNYCCVLDRALNIVICLKEEDVASGFQQVMSVIIRQTKLCLKRLLAKGVSVSASISNIHPGILGIKTAYTQIQELKRYKYILGLKDQVLQYSMVDPSNTGTRVDRREISYIMELLQSATTKDYSAVSHNITDLMNEMFNGSMIIPNNADNIYQAFIHILFVTFEALRNNGDPQVTELLRPDHIFLTGEPIPDIRKNLAKTFEVLENHSMSTTGTQYPVWYYAMLRYIESNFTDVTLNVSSLAESFSLNPSFLSTTFKNYSGTKLLDHINRLRVNYAKRLILEGATLDQAAELAGFGSILTMRRWFLRFEGQTPSKV